MIHARILIIDDHPFYLEGLVHGLHRLPGIACRIDSVSSARHALANYRNFEQFDLVLCDLKLPDIDGLGFLQALQSRHVEVPVAILSASEHAADVQRALQEGAAGYLHKAAGLNELRTALGQLLAGDLYVSPTLCGTPNTFATATPLKPQATPAHATAPPQLTKRQQQVLHLLAEGLSNRDISSTLQLKETTVKSHIQALFQSLNVSNRTACIYRAGALGMLHANQS